MTQERFANLVPGWYVAAISNLPGALPVLRIEGRSVGAGRLKLSVPALENGVFLIRIRENEVTLGFPQGVSVDLHPFTPLDLRHLIWCRKSDYKAWLEVSDLISITPLLAGSGREGRGLKKEPQHLAQVRLCGFIREFPAHVGIVRGMASRGRFPSRAVSQSFRGHGAAVIRCRSSPLPPRSLAGVCLVSWSALLAVPAHNHRERK